MNLARIYRILLFIICVLFLFGLVVYKEKRNLSFEKDKIIIINTENTDKSTIDDEKENMKLYFNDVEVPVIWEDNQTVQELFEEANKKDIIVQMSMYSDNEQVGSLGKSYTRNDKQITTHNGDIVLYSGDKIVVFYGSNSWAYTRLGKMNIPESDVNNLLSNGDIILKIVTVK